MLGILLIAILVLVLLGVPLAFAFGGSSALYMAITTPDFLQMLPQRVWAGSDSFVLIAMPLFILAGELMNTSGITKRLIDFCLYLVRPFRGGLGEVNVVASMFFGGISGSSVADTSALGSVLIPEMEKRGYGRKFSAGITVASSTMGMIIPPSVPMIMYAMISEESIGKLFLAGLIPGILIGITQLVLCVTISKKRGYRPERTPFDIKDFGRTMLRGIPAILMPVMILVLVSFGITTASESAGAAVLYSLILGCFVYKELKLKDIIVALKKTLIMSSAIMLIVGFTNVFTWLLTMNGVPQILGNFITGLNMDKIIIMLVFDVILLFLGTFIDVVPTLLLVTPIMLPIMSAYGVTGLQFGAIMIVACAIGLVTPPVGMCLNACTKINKMPILDIFKGAAPFIVCNIIVLILVSLVPQISMWLPSLSAQ